MRLDSKVENVPDYDDICRAESASSVKLDLVQSVDPTLSEAVVLIYLDIRVWALPDSSFFEFKKSRNV